MESSTVRAAISCLLAVVMVVGFTAAPAAAVDGDDGISLGDDDDVSIDIGDDSSIDDNLSVDDSVGDVVESPTDEEVDVNDSVSDVATDDTQADAQDSPLGNATDEPFPEEVCTDVGEQVQENVPLEQVPWFDDLPQEAQPPGVPTDVVTPQSIAAIVFGATPNQCEVFDPNDPPYNPVTGDDEVDPAYDEEVQYIGENDGGVLGVVLYEATLNESGNGPGASGFVALGANPQYGDNHFRFAVSDGEKEYAVEPRFRYWEDGRIYTYTDVELLNKRLGVEVSCDGEECQPGTRGLPTFVEYPSFPAPTGDDGGDGEEDGPFPSEVCTDLGDRAQENVPFEQVPWFDDLPQEAQPPGVPTDIVTPQSIAAIVFGATPNQCEVFDPNDPPYNPVTGDDEVDPAYDEEVQYIGENDGGILAVVLYDATLNESGNGPGASGFVAVGSNPQYGDNHFRFAVSDGEKEYAVEPRFRYWEDGRIYTYTDVELLNKRLGVEVTCDGEECQPGTRGLPTFVEYPSFPAPTGDE
ncbi:hypothetical protein HWV23_03315 [Natronomonas halophila]|uniref:hypothetical protein n=1 Tax=Natronomonas halophila TaxID=2747817 RepID=UPI0015B56EB4|nr:hypothetical protein [Natronomonas halophila]QLD84781.1 hypothetical protein HWV23_03315 [Natronomonas halophila]